MVEASLARLITLPLCVSRGDPALDPKEKDDSLMKRLTLSREAGKGIERNKEAQTMDTRALDEGSYRHLIGKALPPLTLPATDGSRVRLAELPGHTVVYAYPRTGRPDQDDPAGWKHIPGARGCTVQACAFRGRHRDLRTIGARLFGVSTQNTAYQEEAVQRLHLPFQLLSDSKLEFGRALELPTFRVGNTTFLQRLTLVLCDGVVEQVFYPVANPEDDPNNVLAWLESRIRLGW